MRFLMLVLLLTGCAPDYDRPMKIVWLETYHAQDYFAPHVEFVKGESCPYHPESLNIVRKCDSTIPYCDTSGYVCYWGLFDEIRDLATVVIRDGVYSHTSFAHELNHGYLLFTTGNGDPNHADKSWKPGGRVETANINLQIEGY